MRAAVVGVNWGRVHISALREAGLEVVAVVAQDPTGAHRAATETGVPQALDLPSLHTLDLDVISVATPATTHHRIISELPDVPVICEKPAVGTGPLRTFTRRSPVRVNYAFPWLRSARVAGEIGGVRGARVVCEHDLPGRRGEWFFELATHPLSWLVTLLGEPGVEGGSLICGDVPVAVTVRHRPGLSGLRTTVELDTDSGAVEVVGQYRIGGDWVYTASLGGTALTDPETGPPDPWYTANARSIAAAVHGGDHRVFTWDRALALDRCAQLLTARR